MGQGGTGTGCHSDTGGCLKGDGSHYQVIAVGDMFDGMSRVKKQQAIYAPLMDKIATNEIHALSIKAYTDAEWKRERKFQLPS